MQYTYLKHDGAGNFGVLPTATEHRTAKPKPSWLEGGLIRSGSAELRVGDLEAQENHARLNLQICVPLEKTVLVSSVSPKHNV